MIRATSTMPVFVAETGRVRTLVQRLIRHWIQRGQRRGERVAITHLLARGDDDLARANLDRERLRRRLIEIERLERGADLVEVQPPLSRMLFDPRDRT